MHDALSKFADWLSYPPALSLCIAAVATLALLLRRYRSSGALFALALLWSAAWSLPMASDWLRAPLESRYPARDAASLPRADAIVVLGGGDYAWLGRRCIDPCMLGSSRIMGAARAWRAGRAPYVMLSGSRVETQLMRRALARLDVPASAVLVDARSLDTRQNALHTAALARTNGFRRMILATSALHMPRAMLEFRDAGLDPVPLPVPEKAHRAGRFSRWLPSRSALWRSGRAFKEYLGIVAAKAAIGTPSCRNCRRVVASPALSRGGNG